MPNYSSVNEAIELAAKIAIAAAESGKTVKAIDECFRTSFATIIEMSRDPVKVAKAANERESQ